MFARREHCRSPVARGVFENVARREGLAGEITVDPAGAHAFYRCGEPPDPRAREGVLSRGIDLSGQRVRLLEPEGCERSHYVPRMDEENYRAVSRPRAGGALW